MKVDLKAHAKVNISLKITGKRPDGYHTIESLMQGISMHDDVIVSGDARRDGKSCDAGGTQIYLMITGEELSDGEDNLAVKGAACVCRAYKGEKTKGISIYVDKKLPVSAGIAGGSADAAAAMLATNKIFGYPFSLSELMQLGAGVGADVPFSVMMNAYANRDRLSEMDGIEFATAAAKVSGIGEIVEPISRERMAEFGLVDMNLLLMNPGIGVLSGDAYRKFDELNEQFETESEAKSETKCELNERLETKSETESETKYERSGSDSPLFINDLERCVLPEYKEIDELKNQMIENLPGARRVLMSGSGSTVVAFYDDENNHSADYTKTLFGSWVKDEWSVWSAKTI